VLPRKNWFNPPLNDLEEVEVCAKSGYLAQDDCPKIRQLVPLKGRTTATCPYHKLVHLDRTRRFRVNSNCENVDEMITQKWFVLPPVMEWYYKSQHIEYTQLPPFRDDCSGTQAVMDFIYPKNNGKIYLTKDFNSETQPVILRVAHSRRETQLFWYVDNEYKGVTKTFHEMPIKASTGMHYITVTDEYGNEIKRKIEIVNE
jgi:penicillin-binding protein 1C